MLDQPSKHKALDTRGEGFHPAHERVLQGLAGLCQRQLTVTGKTNVMQLWQFLRLDPGGGRSSVRLWRRTWSAQKKFWHTVWQLRRGRWGKLIHFTFRVLTLRYNGLMKYLDDLLSPTNVFHREGRIREEDSGTVQHYMPVWHRVDNMDSTFGMTDWGVSIYLLILFIWQIQLRITIRQN